MLDLGFVSAILAEKSFDEVIEFASENRFKCVEIMCWPVGKAERRYAGVTHINVDELGDKKVVEINETLKRNNIYVSGLGYYPNPLDADEQQAEVYTGHIKKVIKAAAKLGVPVVNTFVGRDPKKSVDENLDKFAKVWPGIIKIPGLGDVNWRGFFSALTSVKYRGPVCIEVEDKAFEGSEEDIISAILTSRNYLKQFIS